MTLWVDADGCPAAIRRIVERAARRIPVKAVLVANRLVTEADPPWVEVVAVGAESDAADSYLVERAEAGDLAITADIPLAARLVEQGVDVIHPRGDFLNRESISERLAVRNFLTGLRDQGVETPGRRFRDGGPRRFAQVLDRELARRT
jgi:uncharacterized protein YaiI (UPF0178 family)